MISAGCSRGFKSYASMVSLPEPPALWCKESPATARYVDNSTADDNDAGIKKRVSLTEDLDADALAIVLSHLSPADLARCSILCSSLHGPIVAAADLRADLIGTTLAPYRGLHRLGILNVKEHMRDWLTQLDVEAEQIRLHVQQDAESFVYNAQHQVWMPASAVPDAWAAEHIAPPPPLSPMPPT